MSKIKAKYMDVHPTAEIAEDVIIDCETFEVGPYSKISSGVSIKCRNFKAGSYLYMTKGVEIGRGGCQGPRSSVTIGDHVGIFENTVINPSEPVSIGNNVGIGCEVHIWTHGAWLDVLQGFPAGFAGVRIEDNVWLPAKSVVLPGVTIGKNAVVTIASVVNKDLPEGCLAGGNPARVIKHGFYPKSLSEDQKFSIIENLTLSWNQLIKDKGYSNCAARISPGNQFVDIYLSVDSEEFEVRLDYAEGNTMSIQGSPFEDPTCRAWVYLDDMVDYFRRSGLKIFNLRRPFKSLRPKYLV